MFRVVPDQLRVSEGWVRCGQCSEVFDATQNMVPQDDGGIAPPAPGPTTPSAPAPTAAAWSPPAGGAPATPAQSTAAASWPGNGAAAPDKLAKAPASAPPAETRPAAQDPVPPAPRFERHTDDDDARPEPQFAATPDPDWQDSAQSAPRTVIEPRDDTDTDSIDTLPPPELDFPPVPPTTPAVDLAPPRDDRPIPPVSFLHDETPPSVWQRPAVRIVLIVALVLLLGALAMQFLVKERDRVAALQPAMRPVLEAVCAVAGCAIAPLRQIESIVIDSSSFSRVRGDEYRLGFALKNMAPIDVAMPAIELSLTDPQDEPVIRRVILPAEFGARSAALASTAVWTGSLALTVKPEVAAQRIAGYRLLAFYP